MSKRTIIVIIICVIQIFSMRPAKTMASEVTGRDLKAIEVFLEKYDEVNQVGTPKVLYNDDGNECALLYLLYPMGYVVIESKNDLIVEYSFSTSYPYIENEINYYNGPLQYYILDNGGYKHTHTGQIIDEQHYRASRIRFERIAKQSSSSFFDQSLLHNRSPYSYSLSTALRTFDYNNDGRCGSVAVAILLAYYDDVYDPSMVSSYLLSDSTGQIFTDYLKPHIEDLDNIPGSSTADVAAGLHWYFSVNNLYSTYSAITGLAGYISFTTYKNCINIGRPVILDLDDHPTYGEHWVVGHGYDTFTNSNQNFAIVNNGWGNNGMYINWSYIGDIIYLNYPYY